MHDINSAGVEVLGGFAGPHVLSFDTKSQTTPVVQFPSPIQYPVPRALCDKNPSRYGFNQTHSYSSFRYRDTEYYSSFLGGMRKYVQAGPQLPVPYQQPFGNQYVESNLAQPHAHHNSESATRATFHREGQLHVVSQQKQPYSPTAADTPSNALECAQAIEITNASTHMSNFQATTGDVDAQQSAMVYIGDHGHTPANAYSASTNSRTLKEDVICVLPNNCISGEPRRNLSTPSSLSNPIDSLRAFRSTPILTVPTSSSKTSSPSPIDEGVFFRTPSESVSNETQQERYDEWIHQVGKVQLAQFPELESFENISQVSQEKIRGIRADSSGKWAGLSEETIRHMVIKIKLRTRAKRKYDLFLRLQTPTPSDSTTGRQFSVRGTQMVQGQARKYGIGTEAVGARESVSKLAFWDHERAGFAKFERDLAKTRSNTPSVLPLDAKALEKQQTKGPYQHQREFEQFSETFMPRNEGERPTSLGSTHANATKSSNILGASSRVSSVEREAMEQAKVPDSKLQMPTSLALSRGFGGATLSQMMGIDYDEQLIKQLVSLNPGSFMFDKQPEFAPGETTWETLKNMPLD
ncbi:hypothetical protein V500_07049 [Pseudogymnoascus sp. VKM F-4518 (FW-2643)]|nr:hypothetical protein V500_07049 [Pseudogymnoascus sp. VKM F-4518 (FW-2643)]